MSDALSDAIRTLVDHLTTPIREDAPCGDDVTYDDDFLEVKNAVDELGTAADDFDFDVIATKSLELLTSKSKDLRVGVYLVLGRAHVDGLDGMAVGLAGLRAMMQAFWESMHPPQRRAAARRNALQFVADRLTPWFERQDVGLSDLDAIRRAQTELEAIQLFCAEALGDQAPSLSGLRSTFERTITRLEKRAEAAAPASQPSGTGEAETTPRPGDGAPGSAPTSTVHPAAIPPVATSGPPDDLSFGDAVRAILPIATALRRQDPTRPEPYRLLRVMRWGVFQSAPPSDADGTTQLPAPDDQVRLSLPRLLANGAHEKLVEEAEKAFQAGSFHCWLDLQHLSAQALTALGSSHEPVRDALQAEVVALVRRLPALVDLAFKDGTPFASAETKAWIDTLQAAHGGSGAQAMTAREGDADDAAALSTLYDDARAHLADGDLDAALGVLADGVRDDASGQARFLQRLYTARLCLDGGAPAVARPLLEALDRAVDAHGLATWNPALALAVWTRLYTCYQRLPDDAPTTNGVGSVDAAATQVYAKICELDPQAALTL